MNSHSLQRHNILVVGEMQGAIAGAFPSFPGDTATFATRSVHWPDAAAAFDAWPAALFHEQVTFNWLFLDAGDLPAARCLLRQSQLIAPTLVYCRVPGMGADTARVAALLEAESSKDGLGLVLSCYADSAFHAPQLMRAFSREGALEQPAPARPAQEVRAHDPCYAPARELILSSRTVSLSLVQRTLRIGYMRASHLIDAMVGDVLVRDRFTGALSLREA